MLPLNFLYLVAPVQERKLYASSHFYLFPLSHSRVQVRWELTQVKPSAKSCATETVCSGLSDVIRLGQESCA